VLFLFSSLIPISTLAYLSYISVTKTLTEQSRQQLHQTAKTVGYTLIERLDYIYRELSTLAANYDQKRATNRAARFSLDRNSRNIFLAIGMKTSNNKYVAIHNEIDEYPNLTTSQRIYLRNGNPVLTFSDYSRFRKKLMMIVPLKTPGENPDLLIAEVNQNILWDLESIIHEPSLACITTDTYESLYCSSGDIKPAILKEALTVNNKSSATFNWRDNDMDYTAYYWTIFLEGKFAAEPWLVVLSKPRFEDQASIENIKSIYPVVLLLSVLLVILLTSSQIRKILTPLEQLKEATGRVASGDFSSQLDISSNDEFEDLGESFGHMALRLDRQFKSLSAMADIDRTILSSSNENYIVDTILRYIKDIIPCDYVLLSVVDKKKEIIEKKIRESISDSILKNTISLLDADSKLLLSNKDYLLIKSTQNAPDFARDIIKKGVMSLVIYPIFINDSLKSVITLGFRDTRNPHSGDLKHGRELADRVAVAISNTSKEEKIYEQTNFDALTKLPNRTLLTDRLNQAVQRARRNGDQIATLLIDVDRFKNINDSLGHTAGDQLLIEIATRLCTVISDTDTLGRLGGDEFVIVLTDIGYKKNSAALITATAENILNAIKYPFIIHHHEVTVSASIGIAMFPADTMHAEDLLRYAEIAMYHAKSQRKGAYQFYSKDINASSIAQLVLENNLRQAIRNDELELHYQPQIERQSGKIVAAEALLRWSHPELGNLAPDDLLPIADTSGLIVPIGDWVLRKACSQLRQWLDKGMDPPRIAINLSAHQFREQNLIKRVKQILKEFDLDVSYLELEITEDTIMTDVEQTTITLRTLSEMGIRLAVDDFGTGYSSLSYLAKFPIQYLKIDKSFIKDIPQDPNMASIVSAIVALAHSLRLEVVAEGIESQKQYELLEALNCDLFQGFLLGVPMSPEEFEEMYIKEKGMGNKSLKSI